MLSQDRYVIDLGLLVPTLPASPNLALYEAGGDGDGIAIALIGNQVVVYLDDSTTGNTFASDTTFGINISSFAGQVVSIRLQGDYSTASDTAQLDVFNGITTLSSGLVALATDHVQAAGSDALGTGGSGGGSFPGATEANGLGGTPDMAQFQNSVYDIGDGGANVLGTELLEGILYTGATDSDGALAAGLPEPGSWNVVPEPSGALMTLLGLGFLGRRKRR